MTDDGNRGGSGGRGGDPKLASRQHRLKQALRENLKRRKSQARGRGDAAPKTSQADDALPYDDSINERGE